MNINFIQTVFSICKGTQCFTQLYKNSIYRAILHLLLLSLSCGLFIATTQSFIASNELKEYTRLFNDIFGEIEVSEKGIIPAAKPTNIKQLGYQKLLITYIPKDKRMTKINIEDYNKGLIFKSNLFLFWGKITDTQLKVMPFLASKNDTDSLNLINPLILSESALFNLVNESKDIKIDKNFYGEYPFEFSSLIILFFLSHFVSNSFIIFMISLVYTLMFAIFFLMPSSKRKIKFVNFFVLGIYMGFPGIIIAAFFPAFNLPLLEYPTVYALSFLIYSFPVIARLKGELK